MANFIFISPNFPDSYWKWCRALKEVGFNVLGIGDAPYHELSEDLRNSLTEYYCCYNMGDYENEKRAVQYFKDKYGQIDFVESMNEYWLVKDSWIRNDFDVKHGSRYDVVKNYKLKSLEKKFFEDAGANVAKYIVVKDKDDQERILNFAKEVGFPIFAKPNDGVGSQHTFKINDIEGVEDFLQNKNPEDYIVEEFIDGRIVSFDGISDNNGNVIFCDSHVFHSQIAEVVKGELDDYYYCLPEVPADLKEVGTKVVKSFNLENRFFHIEFFRTNKETRFGPKDTLIALEANMRAPGGYTPDIINYANSVSCYKIFAQSCMFNQNREDMTKQKYYAMCVNVRWKYHYAHSFDDILNKYRANIMMMGDYPQVLRDDLGDYYFVGRFLTYEEAHEFQRYIREKK